MSYSNHKVKYQKLYWVVRKVFSFLEMLLSLVSLYLTLLRIETPFHFLTCETKWSMYNRIECIPCMNESLFISLEKTKLLSEQPIIKSFALV